ncbi:MAG TPA: hypothetical protein DEP99_00075 [Nitrospiraceae bacterium]|nr:hypothetical protein [Nitrospiraceae bacterium]
MFYEQITSHRTVLSLGKKGNGTMIRESQEVKKIFDELCAQTKRPFPKFSQPLDAPSKPGVYIIRKKEVVLHVGRTLRGKGGIHQRLKNHLHGLSSFSAKYLKSKGVTLRKDEYTYQYLVLEDPRKRALLEAYAVGTLCPEHIGLGE